MTNAPMNHRLKLMVAFIPLAFPVSVLTQEAAPTGDITTTGSVAAVSQYRLRGVSFSDEDPAIQGSLTVAHKSGFYVGIWSSSLAGYGTFGGANLELDAIGSYSTVVR